MARPIWSGTLSFGLLNIPVQLMAGERRVDLSFRMLDARDKNPVRYERVNAETGEEVPWKDVVKAYEFDKGNYVVLQESDFKAASPEGRDAIEVEGFVPADGIPKAYFEKPYVLVPARKAEKGYVLLRETLRKMGKVGIARLVIRTREHLAAIMPDGDALMLNLLRYPQELVAVDDYPVPEGKLVSYRISAKELEMAAQLIDSMSGDFDPDAYHDEFRKRLHAVIDKRIKAGGKIPRKQETSDEVPEDAATNVVDFMSLLKKSLASNKRTPAKATVDAKRPASKRARKSPKKTTNPGQRPRTKRKAG
ncbi:MAG TPA: Ku protein [Xanthomonadaceae bacterium]|jgi:DNA end-binding protein Ku|nr:Ku protein [Xanthomonadaceae bacterium]